MRMRSHQARTMGMPSAMACAAAFGTLLTLATPAHATLYSFTDSGKASATITTGTNVLTVVLNSLFANPTSAAQELSGIQIVFGAAPSSVGLTSSSGTLIDIVDGLATPATGATIDHWGVAKSGSTIFLATAGTGAKGGKPDDLIIGPGPYTNANPSITTHQPVIQQTGTFDLSVAGILSSSIITSVKFEYGTGPDSFSASIPSSPSNTPNVPEPASIAMLGAGMLAVMWSASRKKHRA